MKRVFLGGTCNESKWRDEMAYILDKMNVDYFNPVVDDWNEEAQVNEIREREECDYCLYVITPKMMGTYSIAEAVDDSNKRPQKTVFVVLDSDESDVFSVSQMKSLEQVGKLIQENNGMYLRTLKQAGWFFSK